MSCTNIRTLFVIAVAALSASSRAVVVFQDDLEGLIVGQSINTQNGWISESYNPDFELGAAISGPSEGITPASGGRMLKMRSAIEKNGGHDVRNVFVQTNSPQYNGKYRYWSASVKAFVRGSDQEPMSVFLGIAAGASSAGYGMTVNLQNGDWVGEDRTQRHQGHSILRQNQWNDFRIDVDWQTLMCSPVINGTSLGSLKFDLPIPNSSNRYMRRFLFGQLTNADLSSKYSYPEGAQPVYFDDYAVTAVPEPSTGLVLLTGCWLVRRRNR